MTQEQIEAVRVRAIVVRNAAITFGGVEQIDLAKTVADDLDALATRLAEVERERDEARRLLSACGDESTACWNNLVKAGQQRDQARADLATLRAAVDEAVDALKAYDDATPEHGDDCRVGPYYHCTCDLRVAHEKARELRGRLRNLTKPDTPSERIMSDKDRENPVEGAHPTQPEGEDALVEEKLLAELALLYNHKDDDSRQFTRWQMAVAIRHGMALASRGLVRGEGVA